MSSASPQQRGLDDEAQASPSVPVPGNRYQLPLLPRPAGPFIAGYTQCQLRALTVAARRFGALALACLFIAACSDSSPTDNNAGGGGGGGDSGGNPSLAISLSANSVALSPGGSASTTVSIQRGGGFSGSVSLSVSGAPAGVTASVSPSSVAQGTSSAVIAWTAAANAPAGGNSVTVTASGSGVSNATATLQVAVTASDAVASVLEVAAGDGQTLAAGTNVQTKPSVRIRDQRGQPMAGVVVTFAVDSGSSVITDSVATTGVDGTATLGSWNAGPGRNVVKATSGTLTPVRFAATGTGEMTAGSATIPAAGGKLTVNRGGDPLKGLSITVAAGSYATPVNLTVSYGTDNSSAPRPTGVRIISPVITIGGAAGFTAGSESAAGILVEVPATFRKNEWPVAMLFDKNTGQYEVMPSGFVDTMRVFAVTRHLDASYVNPVPDAAPATARFFGGSGLRVNGATDPYVQMVIGAVALSDLAGDIDSDYRSATDDWDFDPAIIYDDELRFTNAWPLASAWYFDHFKSGSGNLSGRYRKVPNISLSNSQGLRMGSELTGELKAGAITAMNSLLTLATEGSGISRDSLALLNIKSGLFVTGRPQLLFGRKSGSKDDALVLVYRTRGSAMDVTLGTNSPRVGAPGSIALTGGNTFQPIQWKARAFPAGGDVSFSLDTYYPVGQTVGVNAKTINAAWQKVRAGTAGNGIFPEYHFATEHEDRLTDTIWLPTDSALAWLECENCGSGFAPGAGVTPKHGLAGALLYQKTGNSWSSVNDKVMDKDGLLIDTLDHGKHFGAVAYYLASEPDYVSYLDWTEFTVSRSRVAITPSNPETALDTDLTLNGALPDRSLPAGATWTWETGDGRELTDRGASITFRYPDAPPAGRDYFEVTARVYSEGQLYASGKVKVKIQGPEPFWIIETFNDLNSYPTGSSNWYAAYITALRTNPSSGLLAVRMDTTGREILSITFGAGYTPWNPASCCGNFTKAYIHLGATEGFNVSNTVIGPFFSQYGNFTPSSKWSQSSTDLDEGTMKGVMVLSILPFSFSDFSTQNGPVFSVQMSATRTGNMLTGTMKFLTFSLDDIFSPFADKTPAIHNFNFTARRVR